MATILTSVRPTRIRQIEQILPVQLWFELARLVCGFKADVVVLVARKMPRIWQALELDFGTQAIVITDLSIPFCSSILTGARVAIVDDIINVGTTVTNAERQVMACGAKSVRIFALARTERAEVDPLRTTCASERSINDAELLELAERVPEALGLLNNPFDLDFPILRFRLAVPFSTFEEVYAALVEKFGTERVRDVSTWRGRRAGLFRISLNFSDEDSRGIRKVRLYFDETDRRCNLVPMAIPPVLSGISTYESYFPEFFERISNVVKSANSSATVWAREPESRAEIFLCSLVLGAHALGELSDILSADSPSVVDQAGLELAFGPTASRELLPLVDSILESKPIPTWPVNSERSPLLRSLLDGPYSLMEHIGALIPLGSDVFAVEIVFDELFSWLNSIVGADNVKNYNLNAPFTRDEVIEKPYLRLRLGFTFDDLVWIVREFLPETKHAQASALVSEMLDRFVDEGVVVPTLAEYGGVMYRVYRKGENKHRKRIAQRIAYALGGYKKPLSRTRLAKILTILSLSSRVDTELSVAPEARGNVSVFPQDIVSVQDSEITRYLMITGHIQPSDSSGEGMNA